MLRQIFAAAGGLNAQIRLCSGEKTARADHILELMAMEARAGDFIEIRRVAKMQSRQ
ncbi:MAG: HPr family phosphocarrier protein [Clostridium sp.]